VVPLHFADIALTVESRRVRFYGSVDVEVADADRLELALPADHAATDDLYHPAGEVWPSVNERKYQAVFHIVQDKSVAQTEVLDALHGLTGVALRRTDQHRLACEAGLARLRKWDDQKAAWRYFLRELELGPSHLILVAEAGCGKTEFLKTLAANLTYQGKRVFGAAVSAAASSELSSPYLPTSTIHSLFMFNILTLTSSLNPKIHHRQLRTLRNLDVLVLDEAFTISKRLLYCVRFVVSFTLMRLWY
jgi:hypothetical protein